MARSASTSLVRFVLLDVLLDIVRFPLWWYTRGVVRVARWFRGAVGAAGDALAIIVLAKNLGRPMFGDESRQGRVISFFVRIVQFAVSLVLFAAWTLVLTAVFLCYFALLPAAVWFVLYLLPHG